MIETTAPVIPLDSAALATLETEGRARVARARDERDDAIRQSHTRRAAFLAKTGRVNPRTAEELDVIAQAEARLAEAEDALAVVERASQVAIEDMLGLERA
jgi:hypothetical protein